MRAEHGREATKGPATANEGRAERTRPLLQAALLPALPPAHWEAQEAHARGYGIMTP